MVDTDLPPDLPDRVEVEYRRRSEDGDDVVLKLTPAGARYGWAHGKARVALSYQLPLEDLSSVYATLRHEGFDRIDTVPSEDPARGGTTLRISLGGERHSASAMARHAPAPEHAEAYARCVAAVEALLPEGRGEIVAQLRWDPSMAEHSAGLDLDLGNDLVGVHRRPTAQGDGLELHLELHLARARPLQLQLRHGSPVATATTLTFEAGVDRGVEVVFDADRSAPVVRRLAPQAAPVVAP